MRRRPLQAASSRLPASKPSGSTLLAAAPGVLALLLLNALLSMENWFPTLWPHPVARLSFELAMVLTVLALWRAGRPAAGNRPDRWLAMLLAGASTVWVVARYLDVTVSAVFGRQVNLYWDGRHVLDVAKMGDTAAWQLAAAGIGLLLLPIVLYHLLRACWKAVLRMLASLPRRPVQRAAGLAGAALAASFALHGMAGWNTRWFMSMPVAPILASQAGLLAGQLLPGRATALLTPSPRFDGSLSGIVGSDVLLIFAESYGAGTYDNPMHAARLAPARERLQAEAARGGQQVVTARVQSPTFAGASWLAHAALLSGVDTHDPGAYELLLSTRRPTLASHFKRHGWRTVSWQPGLQKPWPEGGFYGFDRYADADRIGYRGPAFGHWRIPDQAAMALLHAQELSSPRAERAPRFMVFPTLASHAPFRPLAPYASDWQRLLGPEAYRELEMADARQQPVSWLEPVPAYLESLDYTFRWLGDYLATQAPPSLVTIVIGDHQPLASVSGANASWDVPVHVFSSNPHLLRRLRAIGFEAGLTPPATSLGAMHRLTPMLLGAMEAGPDEAVGAAE
ncbi:Phosphoglycerol transferase MdoB [Burkholderiales bacterium 8X]|nr:Phosphoglycerol transferase MdoB [Burkholderiales bacterium 8X]